MSTLTPSRIVLGWCAVVLAISVVTTQVSMDSSLPAEPSDITSVLTIEACSSTEDWLLRETWSKTVDEACAGDVELYIVEACEWFRATCEEMSL